MIPLLEEKREELTRLCARYRVQRLEVFGSAARGDFDPQASDLDFLVEYEQLPPRGAADRYFGLLFALEELFGRPVDLVVLSAVKNPYFLEEIDASRVVLHDAA